MHQYFIKYSNQTAKDAPFSEVGPNGENLDHNYTLVIATDRNLEEGEEANAYNDTICYVILGTMYI